MAFSEDMAEFYDTEEFAETISHEGVDVSAMFFEVRQDIEGTKINQTYCTLPASSASGMVKGDTILRGNKEYVLRSDPTDHSTDNAVKVLDLEFIRSLV